MAETIRHNYECVSEGAEHHIPIPYARLTDITPLVSHPAEITAITAGTEVGGTVLSIDAGDNIAVLDMTTGARYFHEVRNVLTYNPGVAELTWGAINIGDRVYYDDSASMPAGVYLSTSPLNTDGTANSLFGTVVGCNVTDIALYPKGGATASTQECGVAQRGFGA